MTNVDIIEQEEVEADVRSIQREPVPPGPIADLFDRLDDLHSRAGRPSTREIALRAGRGNISSSSVHNIFRNARVPRWNFLEQVVNALGGASEREQFLALWEAAYQAENEGSTDGQTRVAGAGVRSARDTGRPILDPTPKTVQRIWSNEIPPRNRHFTGRTAELERIYENLSDGAGPHVQVIVE